MTKRVLPLFFAALLLVGSYLIRQMGQKFEVDDLAEQSGPYEAFENWYMQRAAPYEKIPQGAFLRATQYSKRMPHERDLGTEVFDTTQWTSVGPDNVGGRTLTVAVNPSSPNIIWAGAASGGLWKSTSAGVGASAWTYVNTGYPTVAVSSVAIDPTNTNIMYIGTGEVGSAYGRGQVGTPGARATYGMGVLKSTDGGTSWTLTGLISTFPQLTAVQKVLLNPLNAATIYTITTEGTYKSNDAGANWSLVHGVLMGMDIVINSSDTTILYACYGQRNSTFGKGVYKSTNAGATWAHLTSLDTTNFGRTCLTISPSNPQVVYASVAHGSTSQLRGLYRTTDAGTSWTLQSSTNYMSSQGWYDNVIAIHPTNQNFVMAAGLDVYKSTNGGSTLTQKAFWYLGYDGTVPAGGPEGPTNYVHADHHAITFDPTNPNTIYIGCDGGIFASTDGGETFGGRNGGYATIQVYNGFATSETNANVALVGLQDNGALKYEGTPSWNKTYGGDGGWCAIDPTNENILYEEYVYLAMSKSTNGGASWFGITSGLATGSSNANFIAPFVISYTNPNILYAGAKVPYKTTSGGSSWSPTNGGVNFNGTTISCIGVSYKNPDTVIAATGSSAVGALFQVFRTTNGGTSWSNVTGSLPNRYPTDISFDPNTSLTAYITYSGYGASHVFKTANAGQTWTDITTNLPDIPTQCVVVDPFFPSHVYVGTDLGVYRSTDGGASWVVFDTGMPPAMVLDLQVSGPNRHLRAATFGNGVYERELTSPGIFDNRALSFISPTSGTEVLVNTMVSPISASFKSVGAITEPDSFDVTYRILNGLSEVYTDTKRIVGLTLGETRNITFDESFTPTSAATYTIQAICSASDQNVANDTLQGTLSVVVAGTIASLNVITAYSPYTEITGGTAGPSGDDSQIRVALPFAFTFDGYAYDSLQLSTNGWAELGSGAAGSERGLSTTAQIGLGNENGRLFSTARPTKALGLWFEDLNTSGGGAITYATHGTAPNRVFIVQWKNMLAYYDPVTTTTRINFQLRLNEETNIAEFCYGPVVAGTLAGGDLGAMTGVKDHVGGNFHFFDFALGGTGTADDGITTLSALTDWPGPDSSYVFGPDITSLTVGLDESWNLVSMPLIRTNNKMPAVFPTHTGVAYEFTGGGYQVIDSLRPGRGYWMKFPNAINQLVWGNPLSSIMVPVNVGWNLVGSVDHSITPPSGGVIEGVFFGYSSSGYSVATSMDPGHGYWVKASGPGSISLGPTSTREENSPDVSSFNSITIANGNGRSQTLWFGEERDHLNVSQFDLPPPFGEAFDARFTSNRILEVFAPSMKNASFPIAMTGAAAPLIITANIKSSKRKMVIEERVDGSVTAVHPLTEGGVVATQNPRSTLVLKISEGEGIPEAYALLQNYPNPFNPSTKIAYDLPGNNRVTLKVFDIQGREVATLVNGDLPAGRFTAEWSGLNSAGTAVSTGMYFYWIEARGENGRDVFSEVRKMLMIK